ncbi:MAG: helix-turn-helix transcriptional regulator [Opitutales bacterium]|jgi:transcriptional regulator with XRE-family HTH domain
MKTGRPSDRPRPPFGARLHAAREAAGLSQAQVAAKLGISSRAYAFWEREPVALRPEQITQVAETLGVSPDHLLGNGEPSKRRGPGPTGKLRQVFERANQLPRAQQSKVAEFVEAFVAAQQTAGPRKAG